MAVLLESMNPNNRKVWNINVGKMSRSKAESYIKKYKRKSATEDWWFENYGDDKALLIYFLKKLADE